MYVDIPDIYQTYTRHIPDMEHMGLLDDARNRPMDPNGRPTARAGAIPAAAVAA